MKRILITSSLLLLIGFSGNAQNVGIGTTVPQSKLDINGGLSIGSYAGTTAAPANGMIVSGSVGIGTASPAQKLDVTGALATNSVNTTSLFRLTRPDNTGVKYANSAEFALGCYSAADFGSYSRLDLKMGNGYTDNPDATVMTWQANGTVGIGTTVIPTESSLVLGARDAANEGGEIQLNAPTGTFNTAFYMDNYQNLLRLMYGTNTGSTGLLMWMRGSDQAIFGKFRTVSYHSTTNSTYHSNSNNTWYIPNAGGEGADDEWIGLTGEDNDMSRTWVAAYDGKLVKIIIRVGGDSGSTPDFAASPVISVNGSFLALDAATMPSVSVDNDNSTSYTPTQNNTFNRGDRISIGFRVNCSSCHIEDTQYFISCVWEYNMQD